jgi:hypothetical protein
MKTSILALLCSLSTALLSSGQVPSLINYQGRLTDASGSPFTGNKNFAISIYDAATGGNLLYSETIGAVTLDSNGVYSFQFGSAGTSNTQVTETISTTDGTTLIYSKVLANSPVVNNSITVTDGTNSWSQSVGNPGAGATATANTISGFVIGATITSGGSGYTSAPTVTISGNGTGATATATLTNGVVTGITIVSAGSGYTTGATITIAPPVIPFRVEYASGTITATYATAPTAGRTIAATYRYGTGGIADALENAGEHWMAITVDGVTQGTRQRVLAVPFAQRAAFAQTAATATTAQTATSAITASSADTAAQLLTQTRAWRPSLLGGTNSGGRFATSLPIRYLSAGEQHNANIQATLPSSIKKITNLYFDRTLEATSSVTSSISIVRYKYSTGEEVLANFVISNNTISRNTSNNPLSIVIDPEYIYNIKFQSGLYVYGVLHDLKLTVEE